MNVDDVGRMSTNAKGSGSDYLDERRLCRVFLNLTDDTPEFHFSD